jgi:phosphohistidine phosphatase
MVLKDPADTAHPALRLLVIRHGQAQRSALSGLDADRDLVLEGQRQARHLAERCQQESVLPALVLHSPARRAVQTAQIFARALHAPLLQVAALAVGEPLGPVGHLIGTYRGMSTLAIVGHNPQLESLAGALVPDLDQMDVSLQTGECLVVDIPRGLEITKALLTDRWRLEESSSD